MKNRIRNRFFGLVLAAFLGCFFGCENDLSQKPINAKTRERIDSISNAEIRKTRDHLDSFYAQNRTVLLKEMMDSLVIVRRREIDEQIKAARKGL